MKGLAPTSRVMNCVHSASLLQQQPLIVQNTLHQSPLFLEDTWPLSAIFRTPVNASHWFPFG